MKKLISALTEKAAKYFNNHVDKVFAKDDFYEIGVLVDAYNTYQDNERDGVDHLFDLTNTEDLVTCIKGGLRAKEISELWTEFNRSADNSIMFLFGQNHYNPTIQTYEQLKGAIQFNSYEIVNNILMYPHAYSKEIYERIVTQNAEE